MTPAKSLLASGDGHQSGPRVLLIVKSVHQGNTAKVARVMAQELDADIMPPEAVSARALAEYDLIGIGSGVYFGRFHADLRSWIANLPPDSARPPVFVFSTSGLAFMRPIWHAGPKRKLDQLGFQVVGEFACPGFDMVGPLRWIGGLNRGRPNELDLQEAAEFARKLRARWLDPAHPCEPLLAAQSSPQPMNLIFSL